MKRYLLSLIIIMSALSSFGQAPESHPAVYLSGCFDTKSDVMAWGLEAGAGYKKFLHKAFFAYPQAGFFYKHYGYEYKWDKPNTGGLNLKCDFGFQNPLTQNYGIDIFTGPDFDWNFRHFYGEKNVDFNRIYFYNEPDRHPRCNTVALRWRVGLSINLDRISIRGAYAFQLTHTFINEGNVSLVEIGVAYRLK